MVDENRRSGSGLPHAVSSTLRSVRARVGTVTGSRRKDDRGEQSAPPQPAAGKTGEAQAGGSAGHSAPAIELNGVSYRQTTNGMKVVGARPDVSEVVVAEEVDGAPVTVIGRGAFAGRTDIVSITLPHSIITLGAEAFTGCTGLTEVELPADLAVINAEAFEGCTALQTVWLPADLTRIARRAFADCTALRRVPHYVRRGIGTVREIDRTLVEEALPTPLAHIGDEAFRGCASLRRVIVPYQVTQISASTFEGCTSLAVVWLHAKVTSIGDRAFAGCTALARLRMPERLVGVGAAAIDPATTVVAAAGSQAAAHAREQSLGLDLVPAETRRIASAFGDDDGQTVEQILAAPDALRDVVDGSEVRPPAEEVVRDDAAAVIPPVEPSRFVRDGAAYRPRHDTGGGDVTITMVGDLMCGPLQQESARCDDGFSFDGAFDDVRPLLATADLSIGNLETMVAPSYPFMDETLYIEDRPHLNAPPAFLSAVRNGGFDVVMNAQNHMYDTGSKGVLETLAALNGAELIHGGMYAHRDEPRSLLFDIRGMRIAVVAYLDPARQRMKQANFTDGGISAFTSHLSRTRVREDIAAARAAGAEFVLAYCHWGREYTDQISQRQARFAQMVADAGADYIFGSHSHCLQPYTLLQSQDGRRVPVVQSGGNFLSDLTRHKPYTDDTVIASLTLTRDEGGRVVLAHDGYTPCRILTGPAVPGWARVVPCDTLVAGAYDSSPVAVEADLRRIESTLGQQYTRLRAPGGAAVRSRGRSGSETAADSAADDQALVDAYSLREPPYAVLHEEPSRRAAGFFRSAEDGVWRREFDSARGEAVIMCGGSLAYDRRMETSAQLGDAYEFRTHFRHVRPVLESADLVIGSLGSMVVDMFPTVSTAPGRYAQRHYANARSEFVDALGYAGFDCLALAHPYNLDGGVRGIAATESTVRDRGLVPSGLGRHRNPVFDVNGVRIAVLSHTIAAYRLREVITAEGAARLLNVFDEDAVRSAICEARDAGAQFILSYLDRRATGTPLRRSEWFRAAELMAECGADYVVCTGPDVVSRYVSHVTADGRTVPIATSLGTFIAGSGAGAETGSALLRIVVRPTADGGVSVDDAYIPLQRFNAYRGARSPVVPAHAHYNPHFAADDFRDGPRRVGAALGDGIGIDSSRRVKIHTHYRPQITPARIAEVIGARFGEADRISLGDAMEVPVHSVVIRKEDLAPGCVAVMAKHSARGRSFDEMTVEAAVEAGAVMLVADEPYEALPTLLVEDPLAALATVTAAIREKYAPFTVAVTGTAGKTTTKEMLAEVFDRHVRTLHVAGNYNTTGTAAVVAQKLAPEDEAYIQEAHGASPGAASLLSTMISPDVCLITSIGEAHLEQMGSLEAIIEGKMQIADGLRPGGALILNDDNPHLQAQEPDVRTLRYSTQDRDVDYRARGIRRVGDALEFEIHAPDGIYEAVVHARALHNVSNALGAFAAGREAGIPAGVIIAGLSRYRSSFTRQNLVEVGGYTLFLDTYNSNPTSLQSAVETLCEIPVAEGGRRIAVLGDMGEQGERFEENHRAVGEMIARHPLDLVICAGPGMEFTAEQLRSRGVDVHLYGGLDEVGAALHTEIAPGDIILFKAAGALELAKSVVYPVFGRIV